MSDTSAVPDIFTEQEDVDPDTLANLGPLKGLAGVWEGAKGLDVNPKAAGPERASFIERIELQRAVLEMPSGAAMRQIAAIDIGDAPGRRGR